MKRTALFLVALLTMVAVFIFFPGRSDKAARMLNARLDSLVSGFSAGEPGGSIMIMKNGKTLYSGSFGLEDIVTGEPFTTKTISNIGSISKTFVAYGILLLREEGRLSLNDSIIKYFPDFIDREIAEKVRIIHLLTHTSGLPDSRNVSDNSEFYLTAGDEENFAPLKLTTTLEFEPGSRWNYSNPSYNGLALIIEQVSGMRWQDFIARNIFEPAGMDDSRITDGAYPDTGVAHGYRRVGNLFGEYDYGEFPTFNAAGNGGVWCSVEDLIKYAEAIDNCSFLDCESVTLSKEVWEFPEWGAPEPSTQGVSWVVNNSSDPEKSLCIEHTGSQGGFRAHLMIYPGEDIVVAWLSNNSRGYTDQIRRILIGLGYIRA
ncbi:MAG: serine hydrolase domain-containing protein [Bacteroidales bacterium]|nr:serine hydrolase domain-containing protein [Bacteroidales bacterium]